MKNIVYLFSFLALAACSPSVDDAENLPIARVHDKYLYANDLQSIVPPNLTEIDSLALVSDYIENWVQQQLILAKAEENLTEIEKDVEEQIQAYRTSLLVYKYEQNLIQQNLDTTITSEQVKEYYDSHTSNFVLNENLLKGLYIKVPISAPDIWKLRRWYKSDKEEHITELDAYCYQHAKETEYFDDTWIRFKEITDRLPNLYGSDKSILKTHKTIEVRDSDYYYFVKVSEYKLEGEIAPVEYVSSNIRSIILNKRKIDFINRLEADIYNDALNRDHFNIY